MNLENIQRALKEQTKNGQLRLIAQDNPLESLSISILINTFFKGSLIAEVQGEAIIQEDIVYGRMIVYISAILSAEIFSFYQGLNSSLTANLAFYLQNNEAQCLITVAMPGEYRLADSFNELKNQPALPINQLTFSQAIYTLNSAQSDTMTFRGNIIHPERQIPLQSIAWILSERLTVSGTVQLKSVSGGAVLPVILWQSDVLNPISFGIFNLSIHLRLRSFVSSLTNKPLPYFFSSYVELVTDFATERLTLPVMMPLYGAGQYLLSFYLDTTQSTPTIQGLDAISGFSGGTNIESMLTSDISFSLDGAAFSLTQLSAVFNPKRRNFINLKIGIGLKLNWAIIPNTLELENVETLVTVQNPAHPSKDNINVMLLAQLKVGSAYLDTTVYYPDLTLEARLAEGSQIDVTEVMKTLARGMGLPGSGQLSIYRLEVYAHVKKGEEAYSFEAAAFGNLNIIDRLEINNISFFIAYQSGGHYEVKLSSTLTLAGVGLCLLADYQKSNGWQFQGSTNQGQQLAIASLTSDLAEKFNSKIELPSILTSLTLENLYIFFNTQSKYFTFSCISKLDINGIPFAIAPDIALTHQQDGSYQKHFGGKIAIADLYFTLSFDRNPNSKTFIATYNNPTGKSQSIKALVASVSNAIAEIVPDELPITLKDALFAYSATTENTTTETKVLFILHIDNGINLSSLPLVGQLFPSNQTIQLHYQLLAASHYFSQDDVKHLNTLVTNGISQLPAQPIGNENNRSKSYFGLAVTLQLGDAIEQLNLPITVDSSSGKIAPTNQITDNSNVQITPTTKTTDSISKDANLTTSEGVKWYPLKKSFGPVHFQKIGVKCQEQKLWFLLDASLATAGLTISLDGLAFSSPLTELKPEFHLNGIGIDYRSDTIEIGGAFLRKKVERDGQTFDEYSGAAILRTQTKGKQLTLSAFGSYTYYKGHPSLFIYALLDYPLGGAPFLFVTGLAAGFGYNRTLRLPEKVEDVAQFPLVKIATGEKTDWEELNSYISPATGELFFAVGIKFTSFKIIDSFALLTVQLGNRSEINILGLSTLIAPPAENGVEPIAKAQLAFRATYLPDEGFLKVEAALLPGAYLFSGNCRLSGRFAFYSWFSGQYEGDFILTLGGYHPDFNIPEHYPKLPRLQLNWQLDNKTFIKGDAYFALCPHTLMAGGHLELTYQSGDFKAWLKAGADFLIAWKPYHYDARIYVTIGASYTFNLSLLFTTVTKTITAEVGADLHLWGPDFGGTATIHIWVVQINIDFGSRSSQQPNPIDWESFKASFLPKDEEVCSIAVQDGLVRKIGNDKSDLGVINPKRFSLVTNSAIPSKQAYKREASSERKIKVNETNANLGIASMAVLSNDLKTEHIITITRNGKNVEEEFQYIPILKKVPTALWGQPPSNDKPLMSSANGQQFIEDALSGFEIKPKEMHNPGQTQAVDRVNLQYEPEPAVNRYSWETLIPFQADSSEDSDRRDRIRNTVTKNSMRENLLKSLGFDPDRDVDLNEAMANDFIIPPQIRPLKNIS